MNQGTGSGSNAAEQLEPNADLSAYLDGVLSPDESAAFEARLDEDPETREELDGMRRLLGALSGLPEVEAPPDLYEQVRRKLRRKPMSPEGWLTGMVTLPFQVLSLVVILAAAAIFLMSELDREHQVVEDEREALDGLEAPPIEDPDDAAEGALGADGGASK